jgi:hypothetical protein
VDGSEKERERGGSGEAREGDQHGRRAARSIALVLAAWATEPAGGWLGESGGGTGSGCSCCLLSWLSFCTQLLKLKPPPPVLHHPRLFSPPPSSLLVLLLLFCLSPATLPLLSSSDPFASSTTATCLCVQHSSVVCLSPLLFSLSLSCVALEKKRDG